MSPPAPDPEIDGSWLINFHCSYCIQRCAKSYEKPKKSRPVDRLFSVLKSSSIKAKNPTGMAESKVMELCDHQAFGVVR